MVAVLAENLHACYSLNQATQHLHGCAAAIVLRDLFLIVAGRSNKEIASALSVSEDTVKWHMESLLTKPGVTDRTQAAVAGIQRGLVQV